jgi:hypothetical protein
MKCSISTCDFDAEDHGFGPYPYCEQHQKDFKSEWCTCRNGGTCFDWAATAKPHHGWCTRHGGSDYEPRVFAPTSAEIVVRGRLWVLPLSRKYELRNEIDASTLFGKIPEGRLSHKKLCTLQGSRCDVLLSKVLSKNGNHPLLDAEVLK